jgi:hypothetical protein
MKRFKTDNKDGEVIIIDNKLAITVTKDEMIIESKDSNDILNIEPYSAFSLKVKIIKDKK